MTETQPKKVPPYSWQDERDLAWHYSFGQTVFERSPMGGMLDHANQRDTQRGWPKIAVLNSAGVTIGWESAVTARPTAEIRPVGGYVPDEDAMTTASLMSRAMIRVSRANRQAASVIEAFFGELGNRWALNDTPYGRYGALFHFTKKGQAIVAAEEAAPGSLPMTPWLRLETLAKVNKAKPFKERTELLTVCSVQALRVEEEARAVWHAASGRSKER